MDEPTAERTQTVEDLISELGAGNLQAGDQLVAHMAHVANREYARGYQQARLDAVLAVNSLEPTA